MRQITLFHPLTAVCHHNTPTPFPLSLPFTPASEVRSGEHNYGAGRGVCYYTVLHNTHSTYPCLPDSTAPMAWRCSVRLQCGRYGVCLLVACLLACFTSQQHASVSQERTCSDKFTCSHTEIEVADQTLYPTQSQYTDTGPTSPSADPRTPGAWQGSHWSANFNVTGMT